MIASPRIAPRSFVSLIGTGDKTVDPELWWSEYHILHEYERWLPHLPRICRLPFRPTYYNIEKYQDSRGGHPSSPKPNLAEIVPQGMTFRPCCLDSFRAVFPTFWWGGIWLRASANAILFRSPYHPTLSRALHPFSLHVASATLPSTPITVIAISQFVWIRNIE